MEKALDCSCNWMQSNGFALKSGLWLRLTRHFKTLRRRRRPETLFGKWLRHSWACAAVSVGLSKTASLLCCHFFSFSPRPIQRCRHRLAGFVRCVDQGHLMSGGYGYRHQDVAAIPAPPHFFCGFVLLPLLLGQIPDVHPQSRPRSILPARQSRQGPGHPASHPQSLSTRPPWSVISIPPCPSHLIPWVPIPPAAVRLLEAFARSLLPVRGSNEYVSHLIQCGNQCDCLLSRLLFRFCGAPPRFVLYVNHTDCARSAYWMQTSTLPV